MRYLTWLLRIALFLVLLGFAMKNNGIVTLRYLFGYEWQLPLVLALLVFLFIGVLIGILAMLDIVVRSRREAARARDALHELRAMQPADDAPESSGQPS